MSQNVAAKVPALSTDQMREVDRLMVEEYGIELIQMMENAGRSLAELARRLSGGTAAGKSIIVLCGTGNNGGGGMAAARFLHNWGARVQVVLTGEASRLKRVPARQWSVIEKLGLGSLSRGPGQQPWLADLVLDAMLGYGSEGDPRPPLSDWIEWANSSSIPVLSLDAPSGLDTTTGRPGDPCIRAAATLTLALPKLGLLRPEAKSFVGEIYLADIGVPPELYAASSLGIGVGAIFAREPIVRLG